MLVVVSTRGVSLLVATETTLGGKLTWNVAIRGISNLPLLLGFGPSINF